MPFTTESACRRRASFLTNSLSLAAGLLFLAAAISTPSAQGQTTGPITPSKIQPPPADSAKTSAQTSSQLNGKPNLSGEWKLNQDQSDDPRKKMQQAMSNSGGRRGGWGGRGSMGGPGGMGRQRGGDEGREREGGGAMDMSDLSELTINQSASTAKVTGATGRVLALFSADNAASTNPSDRDAYKPPAAQWQGDQLVVVTTSTRGSKTTRSYSLAPGGGQLYLETRLESQRFSQPVTFRLVYDLVKPAAGVGQH